GKGTHAVASRPRHQTPALAPPPRPAAAPTPAPKSRKPPSRRKLAQLWQMPLLLVAVGLFAYSAYLFIDPRPGLSVGQRIDTARAYLAQGRPQAAVDQLNKLLASEKL